MAQYRNILSTLSALSNFIANETGRQWHVCDEEILEDRFGLLFGKLDIRDKIYYAIEDDHVEVITLDVFMQIMLEQAFMTILIILDESF